MPCATRNCGANSGAIPGPRLAADLDLPTGRVSRTVYLRIVPQLLMRQFLLRSIPAVSRVELSVFPTPAGWIATFIAPSA